MALARPSAACELPFAARTAAMRARTLSCQLSRVATSDAMLPRWQSMARRSLTHGSNSMLVSKAGESEAQPGGDPRPCRAVGVGTLAAPRQLLGGVRPAGKSSGSVTHLSHHARPGRIPAAQSLASHHDRTRAGCRRWRWRWMAVVHRAQAQAGPEESCHPMTAASSRRKSLAQCCTERE